MKKLVFVLMCLVLTACGGAAGGGSATKLDLKFGGKDAKFEGKGGGFDQSVMTFTEAPKGDGVIRSKTATSLSVTLTNYETDATNWRQPVNAAEKMRVMFSLHGEEGTTKDTPLKPGTYSIKAERYMKVGSLRIASFADGKEKSDDFDAMSSMSKAEGEIKLTAVSADSVSGEINVTEGDKSVKGTFTVKLPAKK